MGAIQKYNSELLMKAVTEYASVETGIIKATDLAKWARENVKGLEKVEPYHFLRKIKKKDPKTGKQTEVMRLCTEKINELNALRKVSVSIETNPIIHSSSVDEFFKYEKVEQRQIILDTRAQIEKLKTHNAYLSKENIRYRDENKILQEKEGELSRRLEELTDTVEHVNFVLERIVAFVDEKQRVEALKQMGITDGDFDFQKYRESMTVSLQEAFSIKKALSNSVPKKQIKKSAEIEGMDWDE